MDKNYVSQLKLFREHMGACFDVLMAYGSEDECEIFYNTPFEIRFHGMRVTIANSADAFQAIEEIIQREIDENEEI